MKKLYYRVNFWALLKTEEIHTYIDMQYCIDEDNIWWYHMLSL